MNVPIPDPSKTEGSSLVLAILVGVAAVVIIALMMQTSKLGDKEGKKDANQDAIAETLDVFNKYDSVIENSGNDAGGNKGEDRAEEDSSTKKKPGRAKHPMHLIKPPAPQEESGEGNAGNDESQASVFFHGFGRGGGNEFLAREVGSEYGALDVVTGDDLVVEEGNTLNELGASPIVFGGRVADDVNPEPTVSQPVLPEPTLPQVDPRTRSAVESAVEGAVPRRFSLTAGSDLDVALREAVAVREGFSAPAEVEPVSHLSGPLFSHPAGSFPLQHFDIQLKLANPNPKRLSRIRYSVSGGEWLVYEGTPIEVAPGTKVTAFCESTDQRWGDSARESREFQAQTITLAPPNILATATEFDARANQRISIAITNPNRHAASRVEYRFGGSPWQVYREVVKIDGSIYRRSGVRVEARVVGVLGVAGRQASESVMIDLAPARGLAPEAVAEADRPESIIESQIFDLAAPERPHGYRARSSSGIGDPALQGSESIERSLLETFEAYRRQRARLETGAAGELEADRWGSFELLMPNAGGPVDEALQAGDSSSESVLDGGAISLFEGAAVGSGTQ